MKSISDRSLWRLLAPPLLLAVFVSYFVAGQTPPAPSQNATSGNAQKGKDAFAMHMCATCHGPAGQGAVGPALPSNLARLTGNAQNGNRVYASDGCYDCHGRVGQGSQSTAAPRIGPPALTIDIFARYIHAPTGNMPPYTTKVVSDQEIADIYAFLKSVPTTPQAKEIPLLNQ